MLQQNIPESTQSIPEQIPEDLETGRLPVCREGELVSRLFSFEGVRGREVVLPVVRPLHLELVYQGGDLGARLDEPLARTPVHRRQAHCKIIVDQLNCWIADE